MFDVNKIKEMYIKEAESGLGSDIKDDFHTMSELYFNRLVLFSVIVNSNKEISWKSKKHDNGTKIDGFFIVGIETPMGQYTYHYQDKYWDLFNVQELEYGKKYDFHTKEDIGRLLSLVK